MVRNTPNLEAIKAIISLAEVQDDLSGHATQLPSALQEALKEELETAKKEKAKKAAKALVNLLEQADEAIQTKVAMVRQVRKQEASLLASIKKIEAAKEEGLKSNNFIPLVTTLGIISPQLLKQYVDNDSLFEIPGAAEKELKK